MATIKAIEGRSVHQIQSGQVIVDLCSVAKELVENSLDAGATSLDVRFKSQGLDAVEVQDNGSGVPKEDYANLALKHYTSKLSTYGDLSNLSTFGFRGEALSSLCALSDLTVTTARDDEAPKGTKLEFETSGKLKSTSVAACPNGTTVSVEGLFRKLPVRRKELEKNIKREYNKVLGILNAYACVCTNIKFTVSNQVGKGKKTVVFATRGNNTTKENISNVYGSKTTAALIPLELTLEMDAPTVTPALAEIQGQQALRNSTVQVRGHVSRPVHGEGRQTPDRQMFFVNSRPCGLPQVAKAFNETYRSYNVTQSPFIFADFLMDTNAYDVNVSPDKRTIMLHDQQNLLNTLKDSLVALFEAQEQTVPLTQGPRERQPGFKPPSFIKQSSSMTTANQQSRSDVPATSSGQQNPSEEDGLSPEPAEPSHDTGLAERSLSPTEIGRRQLASVQVQQDPQSRRIRDFNARLGVPTPVQAPTAEATVLDAELEIPEPATSDSPLSEVPELGVSNSTHINAMKRSPSSGARPLESFAPSGTGSSSSEHRKRKRPAAEVAPASSSRFAKSIRGFAAQGTQVDNEQDEAEVSDPDAPGEYTQIERQAEEDPDWEQLAHERSSPAPTDSEDDDGESPSPAADVEQVSAPDPSIAHEEDIDEAESRRREEARVQKLVTEAELGATAAKQAHLRRAANVLKGSGDDITTLIRPVATSVNHLRSCSQSIRESEQHQQALVEAQDEAPLSTGVSPEERLSLTINKEDFGKMQIIGQFNLGFILAVRTSSSPDHPNSDDLFIIDQHASDEIYNFHRLSATTELTPQPLVRPHLLELTAVEEETVMEHKDGALLKNGFKIAVDTSGESPVGQRCSLLTLPTSRDIVFDTRDLEELLVMLQDAAGSSSADHSHQPLQSMTASSRTIPRPGKVRRMLAMRACRSSIMVGKALTRKGMQAVVRHMGEMERPWNCPHGRPTMRHVCGLGTWNGWTEGMDGAWAHQEDEHEIDDERAWDEGGRTDWRGFLQRMHS